MQAGFDVVGVDNFVNSSARVLERIERVTGRRTVFQALDACDERALDTLFNAHTIDATIHFAALKAVGEGEREPLRYWVNNVGSLTAVCSAMRKRGCKRMVFSSSATVYGAPAELPVRESAPTHAVNVYGRTKLAGEQVLHDLARADAGWTNAILRYFNPVGAHSSGWLGEDPRGVPNNLMPYIAQLAVGRMQRLQVYGNDYPTPDGTGVRDYIHVMDLAEGHVAAVRRVLDHDGSFVVNLGTGRGYSVLELLHAYERACGKRLPHEVVSRRDGDVAACYADVSAAHTLLGWKARRDLDDMCRDSWRWQSNNPQGFDQRVLQPDAA